jgi:hypothetical protein
MAGVYRKGTPHRRSAQRFHFIKGTSRRRWSGGLPHQPAEP